MHIIFPPPVRRLRRRLPRLPGHGVPKTAGSAWLLGLPARLSATLGYGVCLLISTAFGQTGDATSPLTTTVSQPATASTQLDSLLGRDGHRGAGPRPTTAGQLTWQPQSLAERTPTYPSSDVVTSAPSVSLVPTSSGSSDLVGSTRTDQSTSQRLLEASPVNYRADDSARSDPLDDRLPGPRQRPDREESLTSGITSSFGQGGNQLLQTGVALAVVLALVLGFFWLFKRTAPKSLLPLPLETVQVLGNAPLHGKQHLRLIRLGHRVLLLAVSETTSQTLAEVTDPNEVQYLLELCQAKISQVESQTFADILRQSSRERTTGFLGSQQDQVPPSRGSKISPSRAQQPTSESTARSVVRPVSNHFFEA